MAMYLFRRDPYSRMLSEYYFQDLIFRVKSGNRERLPGFSRSDDECRRQVLLLEEAKSRYSDWITTKYRHRTKKIGFHDCHFLPQAEFVADTFLYADNLTGHTALEVGRMLNTSNGNTSNAGCNVVTRQESLSEGP